MSGKDWAPIDSLGLKAFSKDRVSHVPKSSFRNNSMSVIVPSRTSMLHTRFVQALNSIQWPMNQARAMFFVTGAEVGMAYTEQVQAVLQHPELSKWPYVLTVEDDVLVPPDAVMKLLDAIEAGPFDGVGALYWTKSDDLPMPMAYGDPEEYRRTGVLEFRPRDVSGAMKMGGIMPVNGIAMGCSLYRTQMFRDVPPPWFVTSPNSTQDLAFCSKAVRLGKTFATDCRVICGHASWAENKVY